MGDWSVPGSSLSVPPFAGPDDPAFIIGDDMPAGLVTFYANLNRRIIGGIIMRTDASNYEYDVLLVSTGTTIAPLRAVGAVDSVGGVAEQYRIQFVGGGTRMTSAGDHVFNGAVSIGTAAPWSIDSVVQPRGLKGIDSQPADSANFGLEGVVLTTPVISFERNRVYRVYWEGPLFASVANNTTLRVRRGTLAGTILAEWYVPLAATTLTQSFGSCYVANRSAAAISTALVLTVAADVGTTRQAAAPTAVRKLEVFDAGASSDYANAIQI